MKALIALPVERLNREGIAKAREVATEKAGEMGMLLDPDQPWPAIEEGPDDACPNHPWLLSWELRQAERGDWWRMSLPPEGAPEDGVANPKPNRVKDL